MSDCDHNCESCGVEGCSSRIEKAKQNERTKIKKIVGILSGKGGVGKSYVTSLLAVSLAKRGYKVGIMDADITGPSIPKAFGLKGNVYSDGKFIDPKESKIGIKVISANFLLDNESDPIVWRGPLLGGLVKQFYEEVSWGELDYLLIDMPPGTGDVALTIFQMLPVDDLVIITSPQDLVSLIVTKALKMAEMMNIHVKGVIENMAYIECPDCKKHINVFGESHLEQFASEMDFNILGRLPIVPNNASLVDQGKVELIEMEEMEKVVDSFLEE